MNFSLFQNSPPIFSVQRLTSPVPHANVLHIFLNRPQPHQPTFSYTSSAFWFKYSKLSARIQFLHSKQLSQPPHSSYFYHFVKYIVEGIKLIILSRSSQTIIVNWTCIILKILLSKIRSIFPSFF
jgi:hypothetical protein